MAEYNDQKAKIRLIAVVGPTASGKTALAVELAHMLDGEVVSCDSMQIYKGMPIATAAPTEEEMDGVVHHLIGFAEPTEKFSVAEYCELAKSAINNVASRGKAAILCGGTGLYYSSLTDGIAFGAGGEVPELRAGLETRAATEGGEALLRELESFDPECAARLHPADVKRIIRAIEVYRTDGVTMTERLARSRMEPSAFNTIPIGLFFRDRAILYDRINRRVDDMLKNGLVSEARGFFAEKDKKTSVQAIGYKELKGYLDGEQSLEQATESLKQATRRYAKRQLTWFGRDERINRIYVDEHNKGELAGLAAGIIKENEYGE